MLVALIDVGNGGQALGDDREDNQDRLPASPLQAAQSCDSRTAAP